MIERESRHQFLRCSICEEVKLLSRQTVSNPEEMFIAVEDMTADHRDCEPFRHDPERAQRERGVKLRLRKHMRKLEGVKR